MSPKASLLALFIPIFSAISCATTAENQIYELHPLTIATLENFDQRTPSRSGTKNWLGDWIFRRDRLELIDKNLRFVKPDVFFLQNSLEKFESFAESDINILLAGALRDYVSTRVEAEKIELTNETIGAGFIVAPPLQFLTATSEKQKSWKLGEDGFLAVAEVSDGSQVTTLFSLQLPKKKEEAALWLEFTQQRIFEHFQTEVHDKSSCLEKSIIAGRISSDIDRKIMEKFLLGIHFNESSSGFCENAGKCQTSTSMNELFMVTQGDDVASQSDRILVHQSAIVYSSNRAFTEGLDTEKYKSEYGINHLLPSTRYGWNSQVRLKKCR